MGAVAVGRQPSERKIVQALPRWSVLRDLARFGAHYTDAHVAYHVVAGTALLGAVAPAELTAEIHGLVIPTVWALLVGESRQDRKTTVVNIVRDALETLVPERIAVPPGSAEGLLESLVDDPQQVLLYGELGSFLQATANGYMSRVRTVLMEVYDGKPMGRRLARDVSFIDNPRLTMLAGVTPGLLEEHTRISDWTDGFFGRWIAAYFRRERTMPLPVTPPEGLWQRILDRLQAVRDRQPGTFVGFTPAAADFWAGPDRRSGWYTDVTMRYADSANRTAYALCGGVPGIALRLALALAHERGDTSRARWALDRPPLEAACTIAELALNSQLRLLDDVGLSGYARERRRVMEVFARDQRPRTLGEIMAEVYPPMDVRQAKRVVESMVLSGHLWHWEGSAEGARYSTVRPKVAEVDLDDLGGGRVVAFPGGKQ